MDLQGKTIIITGASRGIGAKVARGCAAQGASLILLARNEIDLQEILKTLQTQDQGHHHILGLDVSDEGAVKSFYKDLKKRGIHIDGLVNCAGILGPIGLLEEVSFSEYKHTFDVNFFGTVSMCIGALPFLKETQGHIVNFSGGGATNAFPRYTAYATSKIAIVRFSENIAYEYENAGISVNAVSPGFIATDIHHETLRAGERAGIEYLESTREQLSSGGSSIQKAVNLVVFLLSDESKGITGKLISAQWDPWEQEEWCEQLKTKKNLATLRRIDEKYFSEKI